MAPEQWDDAQKADIRADIYSLGCTLYYLLSGGPPFRGKSIYDMFQAHHSMDARPLNIARADVPNRDPRDGILVEIRAAASSGVLVDRDRRLALRVDLPGDTVHGPHKER